MELKEELTVIEQKSVTYIEQAKALIIRGEETAKEGNNLGNTLKGCIDEIKKKLNGYTAPLKESKKQVMLSISLLEEDAEKAMKPFKDAIDIVNTKQTRFMIAERDKREKAAQEAARIQAENLRKQQEQDAKKETSKRPDLVKEAKIEKVPEVKPEINLDGSYLKKTWKFEIVNVDEVPRMFMVVNESAIREQVTKGIREIKGVRIYQQEDMVRRKI